ncbi:hypothetical protein [Streptomyces anulatus]
MAGTTALVLVLLGGCACVIVALVARAKVDMARIRAGMDQEAGRR